MLLWVVPEKKVKRSSSSRDVKLTHSKVKLANTLKFDTLKKNKKANIMHSVFHNPEPTWVDRISERSQDDLVNVDLEYALQTQNLNAIRTILGWLQKNTLSPDKMSDFHQHLVHARSFEPQKWMSVLKMLDLYDKNNNLAHNWVQHTSDPVEKLHHCINTKEHTPEDRLKKQILVAKHALRTPHIGHCIANASAQEQLEILKGIIDPLSEQWSGFTGSPWDTKNAIALANMFPQFSTEVAFRIAASAFAFHQVLKAFNNTSINRKEFLEEINDFSNEGIASHNLLLLWVSNSVSMESLKTTMADDLETILCNIPTALQDNCIEKIRCSPYASVLSFTQKLESLNQKYVLEQYNLSSDLEHVRKI